MRRRVGAVLLGVSLLAGCTGLPSTSAIAPGRPVGGVVQDAPRVVYEGPVPGADAHDVVAGFLRASGSFDADKSVADAFLTEAGLGQWTPRGFVIFENEVQPTVTVRGTTAHVTVPVTGALDAEGHYRDLPRGSVSTLDLTLDHASGQWRISGGLKDFGAMMSRADFARYSSYAIGYAAGGSGLAVDDDRWFLDGAGLVTRLARAVMEVPPPYLHGAVTNGVPVGVELVGAVSVTDRTAVVELSEPAQRADQATRRLLWSRMTRVLSQVGDVDRVQLEAGGSRLGVDGLPDRPLAPEDVALSEADPDGDIALTRVGTALHPVVPATIASGSVVRATMPLRLPALPEGWYHVALAADASELAAVGGDDAELARWRAGRQVRLPRFATELTRPAYDREGVLWVGGRVGDTPLLLVLDTRAAGVTPLAPHALAVPWLAGRVVTSLEIAADGARLAVVSTASDGSGARVDVAGIVRMGRLPTALSEARTVAGDVSAVVDVTWVDGSTLAVIGRRLADTTQRAVVVPLNGSTSPLGEVPRGVSITSSAGVRSIVVVTSDFHVLLRSGGTFARLLDSREFALPGR